MTNPTLEIELATQPIELCKLLKAVDLVSGGGEAKMVISEGYVYVNGELETQKRKKIYHDDRVEFNGECILVICHAPVEVKPIKTEARQPESKKAPPAKKNNNSRKKPMRGNKSNSNISNKADKLINEDNSKRKPINF